MKIQRFKEFINENEEYLDEPADESFNEILEEIASAIEGEFGGWSTYLNEESSTLYISQDWNVEDLEFEGEEPRVYASYEIRLKLAFQDDPTQMSPELVRLWKLGLAPLSELINGFNYAWAFGVDSKDVDQLDIQEGTSEYEFISIDDITGGQMNDLSDIEAVGKEMVETFNGWVDEQTWQLQQRLQEELDEISGQYDSDDEDEDEDDEEEYQDDED